MAKIKYTCKNCGWETSIREEWGDLKPKRCMNRKCNTSFRAKPNALEIHMPEKTAEEDTSKSQKKHKRQESISKVE